MRWRVHKKLVYTFGILIGIIAVAIPIYSLTRPSVSGKRVPAETVEPSISDATQYGAAETVTGNRFFKKVYAWADYTDVKINRLDVNIEARDGLVPWIQAIDDELKALVTFGGNLEQGGPHLTDGTWANKDFSSFPLYEVDMKTGKVRKLLTPDPYCFAKVIAVSKDVIVWTERSVRHSSGVPYGTSGLVTSSQYGKVTFDPVFHLTIRKTGEDVTVTTPEWQKSGPDSQSPEPFQRPVFLGDNLFFDITLGMTTKKPDYTYALYRYAVPARELTRIGQDLLNPVLFNGDIAWRLLPQEADPSRLTLGTGDKTLLDLQAVPLGSFEKSIFRPTEFGVAGSTLYVLDQDSLTNGEPFYGLRRMTAAAGDPVLTIRDRGTYSGNIIDDFVGLTLWEDSKKTQSAKYLYDPDIDGLVRLDGIPSGLFPVMSGTDLLSDSRGCISCLSDTTRMMYLSSDAPAGFDGNYVLCWFDLADLQQIDAK